MQNGADRDYTPHSSISVTEYAITARQQGRDPSRKKVVAEHTSRVAALARSQARGRNQREARQVGFVALLEALDQYDASRGASFWTFAYPRVRAAIADWASVDHFGVKRPRNGPADPRTARFEARKRPEFFNEELHGTALTPDPEAASIEAEEQLRCEVLVEVLVSGLPRTTLSELRRGNNTLRERMKAFIRGKEGGK